MFRPLMLIVSLVLFAAPAVATTIPLSCATGFNACPAGEAEIQLDVTDLGGAQVSIVVSNLTSSSDIEALYVSASSLIAGIASVTSTPDVDFAAGALGGRPAALPGGGAFTWPIVVSTTGTGLGAQEYVSAGESVELILDVSNFGTSADLVAAIQAGDIRVGVLLNDDGLISVPEPTMAMLLGVGALAAMRRRARR